MMKKVTTQDQNLNDIEFLLFFQYQSGYLTRLEG